MAPHEKNQSYPGHHLYKIEVSGGPQGGPGISKGLAGHAASRETLLDTYRYEKIL
jgi:hypothetical protein